MKRQNPADLLALFAKRKQAIGGTSEEFKPVRPERVFASVHQLQSIVGRSPGLKFFEQQFEVSSQWRDRTGFSPVSLFSPFPGAPRYSNTKNDSVVDADTITRLMGLSNQTLTVDLTVPECY